MVPGIILCTLALLLYNANEDGGRDGAAMVLINFVISILIISHNSPRTLVI